MITWICPNCEAESKLSFLEKSYKGPRRCWKCRGLFTITIENDTVLSSEPLTEEEFEKLQEIEALKAKMRRSD